MEAPFVNRRLVILRSVIVEAGANLKARRMQAALSAFGIATGIAAVVFLVALVSGVHRLALQQINAAGANVVTVTAEADPSARDPKGPQLALLGDDVDTVLRTSLYFDKGTAQNSASAVVRGVAVRGTTFVMNRDTGRGTAVPGQRAYTAQIRGLSRDGFEMQDLMVEFGRLPSPGEYDDSARIVVLGAEAARQVFGSTPAVGKTVVLGDWPFRVIGVLAWQGEPDGEFRNFNDRLMFMPFQTVANVFKGNLVATQISLRVKTPGTEEAAVADARGILARRASRLGETSGRFEFANASDRLAELSLIVNGLKLLVGMVGGISLFVGAVGVANVLLMSVRERRQEIGVRRAIGARKGDVFIGFLCEALALTVGGGAVGIMGAWLLTQVARLFPIPAGAEPHISLVTATIAVTLLTLVGIVSGVGPARRAAAIDPAEALRGE
jgi:putative ABC transport system permease protein